MLTSFGVAIANDNYYYMCGWEGISIDLSVVLLRLRSLLNNTHVSCMFNWLHSHMTIIATMTTSREKHSFCYEPTISKYLHS